MKNICFLLLLPACCGLLLAQSETKPVTHEVRFLTTESGEVAATPEASGSLILNEFTLLGDNVTGVPCFSCVTGAATPNLGILQPSGIIVVGTTYQLDSFLVDQTYTGSCTYTFEVSRQSTVLYSATATFTETAPTTVLLGTSVTLPAGTAAGGASVSNTAVCGASTTKSASAIYIKG